MATFPQEYRSLLAEDKKSVHLTYSAASSYWKDLSTLTFDLRRGWATLTVFREKFDLKKNFMWETGPALAGSVILKYRSSNLVKVDL